MAKSQKKGGGSRKIGRNKRAPTHAAQTARTAANRSRRGTKKPQPKQLKVQRGTARKKRRAQWAGIRTRVQEGAREFWKPTFAEFTNGAVSRPSRLAEVA